MSVEGGTTLKVTDESLAQAARVIRDGGLVVIPTDTVYGVACDPRNKAAIDRIYRLKRRPRYKALQVLLASTDQLDELGLDLPSPLNRLSAAFLPGAFSPIAVARPDLHSSSSLVCRTAVFRFAPHAQTVDTMSPSMLFREITGVFNERNQC